MTRAGEWPDDPSVLLRALARARLPGSDAVRGVEQLIAARLQSLGLHVERQEFTATSRRLVAVSVGAAGCGWCALLSGPLLVLDVPGIAAALVILALLALTGLVSRGLAEGWLPLDLPEVQACNLVATRGEPRVWLVAHVDSKAQGVSIGGRVISLAMAGLGVGGLASLALVRMVTVIPSPVVMPFVGLAVLGAALLSVRPLMPDAPGAVDNATGLISVLAAAEALRDREDVGVLITGAEEFGMLGARHWVGAGGQGRLFVNFDGLDDRGRYNVMPHGVAGAGPGGKPLAEAVSAELTAAGETVRRAPLPVGVFVDGAVLARAGLAGVTISRGDWSTLRVVHTRQDTADRLSGRSAVRAGAAAARAVLGFLVDRPRDNP